MRKLDEYIIENNRIGQFGISYLDDKLGGINANNLILIGARSGAGKTTLSDIIARANRKNEFRTTLYCLENFEGDLFLTKGYYKYKELSGNYKLKQVDFMSGNFEDRLNVMPRVQAYVNEYYAGIDVYSRTEQNITTEMLIDDMIRKYQDLEHPSRLFIIDHLDYLYNEDERTSDVHHITNLMNRLREFQYANKGTGIVAFSHLRKPQNSKQMPAVPSIDEFIGSSNKVKQATAVIMVAPNDEANIESPNSEDKCTFFCIRKNRFGGIDNKVGNLYFSINTGEYRPFYNEFVVDYNGNIINPDGETK